MGKRVFYRAWLRGIFHRPSWVDASSGIFGTGLGAVAHFWPNSMIVEHAWQIPFWGFAALGLLRIALAPYELWKEQKDRADAAVSAHTAFDVNLWAGEDVLRLYQAACLWVEKSPPGNSADPIPVEARPILQRLKRAVTDKRLPFHDDADGKKWLMTCAQPVAIITGVKASTPLEISNRAEVDRAGLIAFAERLNERPKFLFGS